jgi:RNA polymerase sigma-70 factor (ECF subfamily)
MNDPDPFEAIVEAHYEPLYRFAMTLTRADADARDLTQETFYVWACKGHQLRDPLRVRAWLFTTLRRAFLGVRRRQDRISPEPPEDLPGDLPEIQVPPVGASQFDAPQVMSALAHLDEAHRSAVVLCYLEECSYHEIATRLHIPLGTVKSRIARGLVQLRRHLIHREPATLGGNPAPVSDSAPWPRRTMPRRKGAMNEHSIQDSRGRAGTSASPASVAARAVTPRGRWTTLPRAVESPKAADPALPLLQLTLFPQPPESSAGPADVRAQAETASS